MEQINLFDDLNDEVQTDTLIDNTTSGNEEVIVTEYTPEETEILNFAQTIINESFDPWCPLGIYMTSRKVFRLDYKDLKGKDTTKYIIIGSYEAAQKSVKNRKEFRGISGVSITEINESDIPEKAKLVNNPDPLLSFKIDLSLSIPKWFSITYKSKFNRVQVVFDPNATNMSEEEKRIVEQCKISMTGNWCSFDTETTSHENLMELLHMIRPILKDRFEFLYDHRLVEPCCCQLQTATEYRPESCRNQGQCISPYREMQMKCSYRRLMERKGYFTKAAKYEGK